MDYKTELKDLIETTIREGASDLHIAAGYHPAIRVSGFLNPILSKPVISKEDAVAFVTELLTPANKELFFKNLEIDFSYNYEDKARFRGNAYFSQETVAIALRLIPKQVKTFADLNLHQILENFARKNQGFFLVVGPVGQGKSTTLAAMIELINQERAEHIITIEDPIEYIFQPKKSIVNQREVKIDTNDFKTGLKSMFREDVDVIMIGEMRGYETISAAVTAAETGHLVFSTLHTNNASQTIDRIIDSFPPEQQEQIRVQLAGSLNGIFSQRLVPRISGGLVPAYELLINNNAVSNLIREGRTHEINTVIETGLENGMIDMNRCLADLVRKGEITIDNARLFSNNPNVFDRMLQ